MQAAAWPDIKLEALQVLPLEGFAPAPTAIRIQGGVAPICSREYVGSGPDVFSSSLWGFAPVRCRHLTSAVCHLPSAMRLQLPSVIRPSRACHLSSIICGSNPAPRDRASPSRGFAKVETTPPRSTGSEFQLAEARGSLSRGRSRSRFEGVRPENPPSALIEDAISIFRPQGHPKAPPRNTQSSRDRKSPHFLSTGSAARGTAGDRPERLCGACAANSGPGREKVAGA